METKIIDGKKIRSEILEEVKRGVAALPFAPVFSDILVGDDPVSLQYVRMKKKYAESVGIKFYSADFPSSITTEELITEIKKLNAVPNMCGIIIQLPLPAHIDKRTALDAIDQALDVDCLGTEAGKKFYEGDFSLSFPTALACMAVLESLGIDLAAKNIAVIGQGDLVGRPVTRLLLGRNITPVIIVKETAHKEEMIRKANIIISGTGVGKLIRGDMITEGAILVDAGTSESKGGIVGDVDLESVMGIADAVSPVPGGVGPVTVAMLLFNVLKVAQKIARRVLKDGARHDFAKSNEQ